MKKCIRCKLKKRIVFIYTVKTISRGCEHHHLCAECQHVMLMNMINYNPAIRENFASLVYQYNTTTTPALS